MKKIVIFSLSLCILLLSISAGCTYTTRNFDSEGHKSISEKDDLQLVDSYFKSVTIPASSNRPEIHYNTTVVGHIKNNSGRTFRNVNVKINFYFYGNLAGSWMDSVSNLGPGETWAFQVPAVAGGEYPTAYRVTEISGR
jgi:hypothetical protein